MGTAFDLRSILRSGDRDAMGRRRYQKPNVLRTKARNKSDQRWFFRARVDVIMEDGTRRKERPFPLGLCSEIGKREAECDHCYAEARDIRLHGHDNWGKDAFRLFHVDSYWK
jgi:hypothetical protein